MSEPKRKKYTEEFKTEAVRRVRERKPSRGPGGPRARHFRASLRYRWSGEEYKAQSMGLTRAALKAEREERIKLRRENETHRQGERCFKTCGGVLREGTQMKYRAIEDNADRFPIRLMARALKVSAAGY